MGASSESLYSEFSKLMGSEFDMSMMRELIFLLGLHIKQTTKGTMIHQHKYMKELLKRFDVNNTKTINTPIGTATRLDMDEPGPSVNEKKYKSMMESFLYLTASRPDIVYNMGLCARFLTNSKETHLKAIKKILRYLKSTQNLVL